MNLIAFYKQMLKDKNKVRQWIYLAGILSLAVPAYLYVLTFFTAYFNPDGSGTVLVGVNWIGEANVELIILCACIPIWCYVLFTEMTKGFAKLREGISV